MRVCDVTNCGRVHYGKGLCHKHYYRLRRTGDAHTVRVGRRSDDSAERLKSRSKQAGQCLLYTAGRPSRSGHRMMGFRGKRVGVHRVAWILAHGDIAPGVNVLHRCDVPNCINVDHLFLGSIGDNNTDRDRKGRHRPLPGSTNGVAKLSEYQVIEIRDLLAFGQSQRAVAQQYGVSQYAIWRIAAGQGWRHVS